MREMIGLLLAAALFAPPQQTTVSHLPASTEVVRSLVFLNYGYGHDSFQFFNYRYEQGGFQVVGTGFLVAIPVRGDPAHSHLAIVTARHIIDPQWAGCSWSNPDAVTLRIGIWQDSFNLQRNGQRTWLAHPDEKVDVAVIPVDGKLGRIRDKDVRTLRISDFATKDEIEKLHIGIGANIISAGLAHDLQDGGRNYPEFKFGKVSDVPDEPAQLRCGTGPLKDRLGWIIAGKFVPGNSGSPVFLMPLEIARGPLVQFDGPRKMILGLVAGNIDGAGLGAMVPIEYVFEVIAKYYPDADLYRGAEKAKPKSKAGAPTQTPGTH
jgi:hypothetical protein